MTNQEQLELDIDIIEAHHEPEGEVTAEIANEVRKFGPDLYKKFYQAKSAGGFLTVRPWWAAGRVSVDIGALAPSGGLASNTVVWVPAIDLAVYLAAVGDGRGPALYPPQSRQHLEAESYIRYGSKANVSRILRIQYWSETDHDAFAWQTGHFKGRPTTSGAVIPIYDEPLSVDKIRMTRAEMADLSYRLDLGIYAYAATHADWLSDFSGRRPKEKV